MGDNLLVTMENDNPGINHLANDTETTAVDTDTRTATGDTL